MTRPCKIGVQLPEVERFVPWPEVVEMARAAEDVGFDSLWVGDHLLYDLKDGTQRGPWEAWTSLAAIASVTSRVEIGPLVASTSFHAPAMLAKQAATIDAISGGRLIVGLGAGWNQREYTAYGFEYDHRVSRFAEAFTIITTLLRENRIDFDGEYYSARDCVLDPPSGRAGGPPIMVGSNSPRMLSIALPRVDAWNVWWSIYGNTPEGFAAAKADVDAACAVAGRQPGEVQATAAVYVQVAGGEGRTFGGDKNRHMAPVSGSVEEIAERLTAFAEAGAAHLQLVVDPITRQSIEHLGEVLAVLDGAGR